MYLDELTINGFRSCSETTIKLRSGLTVLAGENNSGKSNVLDAIRLLTDPTDGRRTRYASADDLRRGGALEFTVIGRFAELSDSQRGLMVTALGDPQSNVATFGLRYQAPRPRERRGLITTWAGPREGGEPEPGARGRIRHVHLPALRDAQRELASSSPERIAFLLGQLASTDDEVPAFEALANDGLSSLERQPLVVRARDRVSKGVEGLSEGVRTHRADLGFEKATLRRLARGLRFRLLEDGIDPIELSDSGLGYSNLLFIAAVLVELEAAKDAELTLFLVEEPEAHLHPQLQTFVLRYLQDRAMASSSSGRGVGEPAGQIQVIVTTHSPHLTSAVTCARVVVLQSERVKLTASPGAVAALANDPDAPAPSPPSASRSGSAGLVTRAVGIAQLGLRDEVMGKVDRYLDVTRSAMLFARRVMLVEGIAEALLIPVLADRCVFAADDRARARFRATTLVPIDGVDFEPYVRLLLASAAGNRLAERVVVVTDGDPGTPGEGRPDSLRRVATELGALEALHLHVAEVTLEAELMRAGNDALLRECFMEARPRSGGRWDAEVAARSAGDRPGAYVQLLTAVDVRKGDHAQALAARVLAGAAISCPDYLAASVRSLVDLG